MVNVAFQRRGIRARHTQPKQGSVIAAAQTIAPMWKAVVWRRPRNISSHGERLGANASVACITALRVVVAGIVLTGPTPRSHQFTAAS